MKIFDIHENKILDVEKIHKTKTERKNEYKQRKNRSSNYPWWIAACIWVAGHLLSPPHREKAGRILWALDIPTCCSLRKNKFTNKQCNQSKIFILKRWAKMENKSILTTIVIKIFNAIFVIGVIFLIVFRKRKRYDKWIITKKDNWINYSKI